MTKYGMVIDISRCNGCYNCVLACKDEYCGNEHPPYSAAQPLTGHFWMQLIENERGRYPKVKVAYIAIPCLQCQDAPCLRAGADGAVYRRPDGIIIIDPEKAAGRKEIVSACPYRVIYWNEEKNIPQKCTFCAHLLDQGWKEPRCVEACPTGALVFGDLDNPNSQISQIIASRHVEELHPEYGRKPNVYYIGLPRRFIAGTVIFEDRDDECAENVTVTLSGETIRETVTTDNYGDFEFEGLLPETEYSLRIEHAGYAPEEYHVITKTDIYLGEMALSRAK